MNRKSMMIEFDFIISHDSAFFALIYQYRMFFSSLMNAKVTNCGIRLCTITARVSKPSMNEIMMTRRKAIAQFTSVTTIMSKTNVGELTNRISPNHTTTRRSVHFVLTSLRQRESRSVYKLHFFSSPLGYYGNRPRINVGAYRFILLRGRRRRYYVDGVAYD